MTLEVLNFYHRMHLSKKKLTAEVKRKHGVKKQREIKVELLTFQEVMCRDD